MIQVATVSKDFKEIIISDGFRSNVRCCVNQKRHLLGLFPKCSRNTTERYRFVQCSGALTYLPRPMQAASFWAQLSWKPKSYWREIELLDCRDGKVLLLAGNTNRSRDFVIYYVQLRTNQYRQLPRLTLLDESDIRLVSAAFIPDDKSHQFRVIVLARRGEADTKIKPEARAVETSVVCFTSSTGKWENPVTTWFEVPAKNMLGLGSVLVENKLCFLEKCRRVITVDITSLELGTIVLPKVKNIGSKTSHVLTRGPRSKKLYLAIVSQRCIAVYSHDGKDWVQNLLHPGPGHTKSVALKLIGSTDITGLILVKADGRVIYKMEVETGLFYQIDDNVPEEEALPFELEYPPVSQMLLRQKNAH
ncbi:unnamed protein product [Alopecurus aequalis]